MQCLAVELTARTGFAHHQMNRSFFKTLIFGNKAIDQILYWGYNRAIATTSSQFIPFNSFMEMLYKMWSSLLHCSRTTVLTIPFRTAARDLPLHDQAG